jgi:protein-disulfide isomerase
MTPEHKIDAIKRETQRVTAVADFDAAAARFQADLEHDIADGIAAGIKATPTVFINGVRVPDKGQLPPEYFDAAIALELKRKQ